MCGISGCQNTDGKPLAFETLTETHQWRPSEGTNYLVVTENNWSSYYSAVPSNADLSRNTYVVVSLGNKPNPAYTVKFLSIKLDGDKVKICLEMGEPVPGRFYPQIVVFPVAVAEVLKNQLPPEKSLSFVFIDQKGTQLANL